MNMRIATLVTSLGIASLSACGGASTTGPSPTVKSTPAPLETTPFMTIANDTTCANLQNRLFVIDQQYVFSEKLGSCSDSSYRQTLYGKSPDTVLCSNADSIAGPRFTCSDPNLSALFKQIINNLDAADLGLGRDHQVQQIAVSSKDETTLATSALAPRLFYGKAPSNLVLKDAKLWEQFAALGNFASPSKLSLDFDSQMLLGVFFKVPNNCSEIQILKVSSNGQKVLAQYTEKNLVSIASCDTSSNAASTPMSLVATQRLALPVEFVDVSGMSIATETVDQSNVSGVTVSRNFVITDQTSWNKLWAEHNGQQAAPSIDFSKKTAIAVFSGTKPNGCYGIADVKVWRYNNRTNVSIRESTPQPTQTCAMYMPSPALIFTIDKTSDSIDFATIPVVN